jgi:lipopolysaccharide transport system permease protein
MAQSEQAQPTPSTGLTPDAAAREIITLRPSRGMVALNLRDLWFFRELVYFLTWRDIKVRYKQTILGAGWAILSPVINMIVLSIIFGNLAGLSTDGLPRPVFTFAALLPWGLFSKALSDAGRSMLANRNMITKIYFPRLIIPLSSVLGGVVDFLIAFLVLIGMMVYYGIAPQPQVWALPLFTLLSILTALGVGLWLSALNVLYRDVNYILPFLTQFWLLLSPVGYSAKEIPEQWQFVYALNPMTGVIEGFRWALLGTSDGPGITLVISSAVALLLLISGLYYFRYMERTFADTI